MGTENLDRPIDTDGTVNAITPQQLQQFFSALTGLLVGRNPITGIPESGHDVGSILRPFGTGHFNALSVAGAELNLANLENVGRAPQLINIDNPVWERQNTTTALIVYEGFSGNLFNIDADNPAPGTIGDPVPTGQQPPIGTAGIGDGLIGIKRVLADFRFFRDIDSDAGGAQPGVTKTYRTIAEPEIAVASNLTEDSYQPATIQFSLTTLGDVQSFSASADARLIPGGIEFWVIPLSNA